MLLLVRRCCPGRDYLAAGAGTAGIIGEMAQLKAFRTGDAQQGAGT
jgi:hypothetical protein